MWESNFSFSSCGGSAYLILFTYSLRLPSGFVFTRMLGSPFFRRDLIGVGVVSVLIEDFFVFKFPDEMVNC